MGKFGFGVWVTCIIIDMEYELYLYCTGMGTLIIFLIVLYHCLGNGDKEVDQEEDQRAARKV
jgi:hypothetical protein